MDNDNPYIFFPIAGTDIIVESSDDYDCTEEPDEDD